METVVEKMKVHIKSEPEIRLEIPNPSEQLKQFTVEKALMHAFQFAQAEKPTPSINFQKMLDEAQPSVITEQPVHTDLHRYSQVSTLDGLAPKKHDQLEVVHEEQPSGFGTTIGERMQAAMKKKEEPVVEENDPSKTGFKIDDDGKKRYKVRYKCPNNRCKTESNHFVPEGVKEVQCHECGTSMKLRRATQDAELTPDPYLNFYIAGSRTPYYEYVHNK